VNFYDFSSSLKIHLGIREKKEKNQSLTSRPTRAQSPNPIPSRARAPRIFPNRRRFPDSLSPSILSLHSLSSRRLLLSLSLPCFSRPAEADAAQPPNQAADRATRRRAPCSRAARAQAARPALHLRSREPRRTAAPSARSPCAQPRLARPYTVEQPDRPCPSPCAASPSARKPPSVRLGVNGA
jgi:hypothetical protein